jgi:hypothetical protein
MRAKLLVIAGIIAGPVFIFLGFKDKAAMDKIQANGITVPAVIEGGERKSGRRGSKSYKFDVSYVTQAGKPVRRTFSAPKSYVEQHVRDDTIFNDVAEVRYLADDPQEAVLVGAEDDPMALVYLGGVFLVAGGIGSIFVFRKKAAPVAAAA